MDSQQGTVFRIEDDGLDTFAFLVGVRRVVLGNAQLDSVVSAAMVRHIDFLLTRANLNGSDPRLDERAAQIDTGLRNVLAPAAAGHTHPSTAAFKQLISDGQRDTPTTPTPPSGRQQPGAPAADRDSDQGSHPRPQRPRFARRKPDRH